MKMFYVWVKQNGDVDRVQFNQHGGYYFRDFDSIEKVGKRPVVYIGQRSH